MGDMKTIAFISSKGGTGKTTLVESFRQYLNNAAIVDMDHQKTLTFALKAAQRDIKIENPDFVLYDTPPYNSESLRALMQEVDHIVIPTKIGYPDLLAFHAIYESLLKTKTIDKALLVFNDVRKPLTDEAQEIIKCFSQNYPQINIAKNMMSRLSSFSCVFRDQLAGKAFEQIKLLEKEILNK